MNVKRFQTHRGEFERLGRQIYEEQLKQRLESEYKGKIVAIEVGSGEYFLGDTVVEAIKKGEAMYPGELFYVIRVGYPAVYVRR